MGDTYRNYVAIMPLFIVFLCLNDVVTAGIHHQVRNNKQLNFLVVGDWGRKGAFNQSLVAKQMGEVGEKLGVEFVISTGDNFYKVGLKGLDDPAFTESFTNIYTARSLRKPWYAILGNHDYLGNVQAQLSPLLKKRDPRWHCDRSYTVRAGFLELFFIDTTPFVNEYFVKQPNQTDRFNWRDIQPRNRYLSTLIQQLKTALRASNATWKMVVGHHPIRSIGKHGDTIELHRELLPILQQNRVPFYINGHDHCLEHINNTGVPIEFLTSGGGSRAWSKKAHFDRYKNNLRFYYDGQGFMSAQLTRSEANVSFYGVSGKILHTFKIRK